MMAAVNGLSRIDKLFVDRDGTEADAARARREGFTVAICCGRDVEGSHTLQLAALTAVSLAARCFPGAVRVMLSEKLQAARLLVWPSLNLTIMDAFTAQLGAQAITTTPPAASAAILIGDAPPIQKALRVTFDGWIAKVGPAARTERLPEREYCSLAGVLGAAIAISEVFLSFAEISIEAGRRVVALSLWRPDADPSDPAALGVPVEYLPGSLWVLGLGHLGNAYLWALASLPYADPKAVLVYLNDYDSVEPENIETGILFRPDDVPALKTRVCNAWLAARGFRTRMIERPFDAHFRCRKEDPAKEPLLALCGFDSNPVRRDLAGAGFLRVVDSGLGNTASNFDTLSMHTLPNPRPADKLWPDLSAEELAKRAKEQDRMARENTAYATLGSDECGRYDLAGKSVAVPFVGAAAASFVLAETLRLFHGGPAYTDLKFSLATPGRCAAACSGVYMARDLAGLDYAMAAATQP
jgi:hypothetical protein